MTPDTTAGAREIENAIKRYDDWLIENCIYLAKIVKTAGDPQYALAVDGRLKTLQFAQRTFREMFKIKGAQ